MGIKGNQGSVYWVEDEARDTINTSEVSKVLVCCSFYIMAEEDWAFNAFDFDGFEPNIDDSEDFKLGNKEYSKRFGSPLPENAIVRAICERVASCKNTKGNALGSPCFSVVVRCS